MANPVIKYALAAVLPAAVVGAGYGPFKCNEVFGCTGGQVASQSWLLAVVLAAAVGVAATAVVDIAINGRYALANRAEGKRRRRAEARRKNRPSESD